VPDVILRLPIKLQFSIWIYLNGYSYVDGAIIEEESGLNNMGECADSEMENYKKNGLTFILKYSILNILI